MSKKIAISDTLDHYTMDKVNCYERPMANVMTYWCEYYGSCFLMLSKLYAIYHIKQEGTRETVLKDLEHVFGMDVIQPKKYNTKFIADCIEANIPVVLGGNLKELFYSSYYKESDWPHWFLIYGYDAIKKIFHVIDSSQYLSISEKYGEFILMEEIMKQMNKSYNKHYQGYSCLALRLSKRPIEQQQLMTYILENYLMVDPAYDHSYIQYQYLSELRQLVRGLHNSEGMVNEFKRELINRNKYREVFFQELGQYMKKIGYSNKLIETYEEVCTKLNKEWNQFIVVSLVQVLGKSEKSIGVPDSIKQAEHELKSSIQEFYEYNKHWIHNEQTEQEVSVTENLTSKYQFEHNEDQIIRLHNDKIIFKFHKQRTYDWWFTNEAPLVVLTSSDTLDERLQMRATYEVNREISVGKFQLGIFLRCRAIESNMERTYLCGVDYDGLFIMDQEGFENNQTPLEFSYKRELFARVDENRLIAGTITDGKENIRLEHSLSDVFDSFEMGLTCKTWEKPGKLELQFTEIKLGALKYEYQ